MGYWLIISLINNNNSYGALVQSIHNVIMNNYDSNTTEINFRSLYMCSSYTCAVVILHYPSGHPTSLIEHLQNVELAARITSLLPPALISGSVQLMLYLLIVIIHVSVGNIVWLDRQWIIDIIMSWTFTCGYHQLSFNIKFFGGILYPSTWIHHSISGQQISVGIMMSMHSIDLMESYSVHNVHTYVSDHFGIISYTFNYRYVIKHCLRISLLIFLNC